jgi:MinD-like ATPase involved in chromosome partitioning or flagellar assembly
VRVLAEIPARPSPDLRAGTLRRGDLEAYGRLLEALAGARSVLIAGDGLGRHGAVVGLAAAAAAAGTRTALLECELEAPALADALGLATAPGLHEYLRGAAEAEQILKPVALAGPGSGEASDPLVCVVAGRPAGGAAALLDSERFRHAVAGLRDAYELLVVDGPAPRPDPAPLTAVAAEVDTVLAWAGPDAAPPGLPVAVTGLVVQS